MKTWETKHASERDADFKKQLLSDPEVAKLLTKKELEELCSPDFHFRGIKARFTELGL
jgi:hypothetical protein